jgi:hypothetical protein
MECIFTNKALLDKEYKRLFLERISNYSQLKDCVSGRYNKKIITDAELGTLFSDNHKTIYDFIGSSNENRIRYFFGTANKIDIRDNQTRLIDRLILDSVHFDVINNLMLQFSNEYNAHQKSIDKEWEAEIQSHDGLGIIPTLFIIQNAIKHNKSRVFEDLVFPVQNPVELFKLTRQNIIPDAQIFKKWIPELNKQPKSNYTYYILFAGIAATLALFIPLIYLAIAGSTAGLGVASATTSFSTVGVFAGVFIALIFNNLITNTITTCLNFFDEDNEQNTSNNDLESRLLSTEMMMTKLPKNLNGSLRTPMAPFNIKSGTLFISKVIATEEAQNGRNDEKGLIFP